MTGLPLRGEGFQKAWDMERKNGRKKERNGRAEKVRAIPGGPRRARPPKTAQIDFVLFTLDTRETKKTYSPHHEENSSSKSDSNHGWASSKNCADIFPKGRKNGSPETLFSKSLYALRLQEKGRGTRRPTGLRKKLEAVGPPSGGRGVDFTYGVCGSNKEISAWLQTEQARVTFREPTRRKKTRD